MSISPITNNVTTAVVQASISNTRASGQPTRADDPASDTSTVSDLTFAPQEMSAETLQKAVQEVSEAVKPVAQSLQFTMEKDLGRTVVKVMDTETKEVIRQIPSEEILAIAKALNKLQGLLVEQKV
jgi:flagellar protein FlaG